LLIRDAAACVANVDAHVLARTTAANEDPAFGVGIFDSVANQISENAVEKQRIAHNGHTSGAQNDIDPFPSCAFVIFGACLPKQRFELNGREPGLSGMLIEPKSPQQLVELPSEAIDCVLTQLQHLLFGFGPDADVETVMSTLDNLQRLSKIVTGHGKEHALKIGGLLQVCSAGPSQGYLLPGRPHDAGSPVIGDNREPFACVGHDVRSSS